MVKKENEVFAEIAKNLKAISEELKKINSTLYRR